jgi:micrococcal nuclease
MPTQRKFIALAALLLLLISSTLFIKPKDTTKENTQQSTVISNTPAPTEVYTPSITPVQGASTTDFGEVYRVEKVIDGDTIAVVKDGIKETIRLIGINTPESVDPRRPVECFGVEASNKAKELLTGRNVYLEEDPTQGTRDKYNRALRYVRREDGLFYNLWIIQNGYAYEYTYDTSYKYQAEFKRAQSDAQAKGVGLWGGACAVSKTPRKSNGSGALSPQTIAGDKDCSDFTTHQAAQDFFIAQGGPGSDPHKLDSDGDGLVCESLP